MTDLKFKILEHIYSASPTHEELLVPLINSLAETKIDTHVNIQCAINELASQGYVRFPLGSDYVRLTSPAGIVAFETAKECRKQYTKDKKQQGFNNKVSIVNLILSIVIPFTTFILGILVDRLALIDRILSIFK